MYYPFLFCFPHVPCRMAALTFLISFVSGFLPLLSPRTKSIIGRFLSNLCQMMAKLLQYVSTKKEAPFHRQKIICGRGPPSFSLFLKEVRYLNGLFSHAAAGGHPRLCRRYCPACRTHAALRPCSGRTNRANLTVHRHSAHHIP